MVHHKLKWIGLIIGMILLSACGQGTIDGKSNQEQTANILAEATFLNQSWIEKGYDGKLAPVEIAVGASEQAVAQQLGTPKSTGYYEGGRFQEFAQATFFINEDLERVVAIALDIFSQRLTAAELTEALGSPDESYFDEMDGFWIYAYQLDEYELFFEADKEGGTLQFVWLREN
ncbi:DUF4309 domain-containing protein [Halalkalibacterium ligniniphilum]|uniref:DUF4309 domain-containing protein n=1 Tax=Halalkalibacterium ligniniphilum TaxID=1134413 RepID=UPI00034A173C|nr:DUF4309 domain-containing protein [Halalkalibacterium ligniniphilum]